LSWIGVEEYPEMAFKAIYSGSTKRALRLTLFFIWEMAGRKQNTGSSVWVDP
jgi:hypothetical protein